MAERSKIQLHHILCKEVVKTLPEGFAILLPDFDRNAGYNLKPLTTHPDGASPAR